ncbi:MAG: penicillin acylase family protein [Candidatus Dormibacteria bacterium]
MPAPVVVLAGVLLALVALVLVALAGYFVIFLRPLPRTRGHLIVDGLLGPVRVARDEQGVPHVEAANDHDLAFAVGFLHGQERLWQMELQRRAAAGRLCEVLGERALPVDRLMRRLGLRRVSEAEWHVTLATGEVRRLLIAYSDGVNAAISDRPLPAEFKIARHRPEPWEPEDTLAVGRLLGLSQAGNWEAQLLRMRLLRAVGPALAAEIEGETWMQPAGGIPDLAAAAGADLLSALSLADEVLKLSSWTSASNTWAVSGARSTTGSPLLANDPHSSLGIPSPWYQVHLTAPGLELAGMTFCGLPFLVMGHNQEIAWGLANAQVSLQDLYVERFNPNNPLQFADPDGWSDAVRFRETIRVRGRATVTEDVLVTRRGPVISPAVPGQQPPLSLRWVGLDSEVDSLGWLHRLNRARDWPAFRAAVGSCSSPALSVSYASRAGDIGLRVSGFIPVRPPGGGRVPSRGWDGSGEWLGYVDFAAVPETHNPASGYVVAANDARPAADGSVPVGEYALPYRRERISSLLTRGRIDVAGCVSLQGDVLSLPGLQLRDIISGLATSGAMAGLSGAGTAALAALTGWDGAVTPSSAGALVYLELMHRLRRMALPAGLGAELVEQLLGRSVSGLFAAGPFVGRLTAPVLELLASGRGRFGDASRPASIAVLEALEQTGVVLARAHGSDSARWRLSEARGIRFRHPLGAIFGVLRPILDRGPFPLGGDLDTVFQVGRGGQAAITASDWAPFHRAVYDTGDWSRSLAVHVPGQSGHPGSRHYADLVPLWGTGKLLPVMFGAQAKGASLELVPGPPSS